MDGLGQRLAWRFKRQPESKSNLMHLTGWILSLLVQDLDLYTHIQLGKWVTIAKASNSPGERPRQCMQVLYVLYITYGHYPVGADIARSSEPLELSAFGNQVGITI